MKKETADEFLKLARDRFDESDAAETDNRINAVHDTKFENGDNQWTDAEKQQRQNRPCITDNRVSGAVKIILGDALMNRPSGKVRPVDSAGDPTTAEIFTGLIRNIENISDAEDAYDTGHASAVRGNIGYWRVTADYSDDDSFEQDLLIERIVNPQAVYYDQSAIKKNYEDSEYCFLIETMRKSKFQDTYPNAQITDWNQEGQGESMAGWFGKETVRVAEYWYKEPYTKHIFLLEDGKVIEVKNPEMKLTPIEGGQAIQTVQDEDGTPMVYLKHREVQSQRVMQAIISGAEILREPKEWPGKHIPIIPCLGEEVWIEGERVLRSAIRHAVEPQKIHNWNVSNDMETKALSPKQPWLLTAEQIKGHENNWNEAYITPKPYLLYNFVAGQNPPQRLFGSVSDAGAVQGIAMSIDSIKAAIGVFDASMGNRSNETSGIAIERRQRQSSTSTYVYIDNQTKAIKHTWRILIDLIPKIYDSDRIVRLLGDDFKKKFKNKFTDQAGNPITDQTGKPILNIAEDGMSALARINFKDPMTGKIYNDLSVGKYDVVIDAGPGYMTRRQEAADGMLQLTQANPQVIPVTVPRIAKNLDWPDADEIGDELKQIMQPQGPSPKDQLDAMKGEQDLQKGQLEIQGKQLDLVGKDQDMRASSMEGDERMALIARQVVIGTLQELGAL